MRVVAAEDDLRAARFTVDVLHIGDDSIAWAVRFARRLLAEGEDAFGSTEVDDEVVSFLEAAHDPFDELPLAILELVENEVSLLVAHALDEHLLRGLRRDAAERLPGLLNSQNVAV